MRLEKTRSWRIAAPVLIAWLIAGTVAIATAQTPASAGKGFIWKVERDGRVGWLVGSLHLLTSDAYPLPDSMDKAFLGADALVEETDPEELSTPDAAAQLISKAFYTNGQTLETQLSAPTYRKIADRAARAGLPIEKLQKMKPWMIAITLVALEMQRGGFDPNLGLDKHFRDKAPRFGKKFRTLEGAMEQIEYLERLSPQLQDALVNESLDGADAEIGQLRRIAAAWKAGDAVTVERILVDSMKDSPAVYQSLIVERNQRWLPKIDDCLATARCFIVVGAAHVVGKDGLIELMRSRGYAIEQQ